MNTRYFKIIIFLSGLGFFSGMLYSLKASETRSSVVSTPSLVAKLVDVQKNATNKSATVEVTVTGVKLIDPSSLVRGKAGKKEGHLHYQIDEGYIIATPASKLSFHGLSSGAHKIVVMLASNNHEPLGPKEVLSVSIP